MAPTGLSVTIVSPEEEFFLVVERVSLPSAEGRFEVLPGHAPLFAQIAPGEAWLTVSGELRGLVLGEGFTRVESDRVFILTDIVITDENVDHLGLEKVAEKAVATLEDLDGSGREISLVQAALARLAAELKRIKR
jgi:F-type H+-transporting ATPase subunit epsilon